MDINAICEDLSAILSDIVVRPEETVKRWSDVECKNYQLPLALITGFLSDAVPPFSRESIPIRDRAEFLAIVDIVRNSNLNAILEFDPAENKIKYRNGIPDSIKEDLSKYIVARVRVIED